MSKITPKNLHYDTTLPPFLARLRENQTSRDGRHEFDVARPRKQRDAAADAEDEPVYVDEATGDSLTKGEWEERQREQEESAPRKEGEGEEGKPGTVREGPRKENMAVIGGVKKRKMGKVVGVEENGEDREDGIDPTEDKSKSKDDKENRKKAKKGKKIKLSFGDDE